MAKIADILEHNNVTTLIILGDLTEDKDFHSAALVNDIVDIIFSFAQFCDVIVDRGNHDYTRADCPFFQFLRRIKRVRWINKVTRLDLDIGHCLFLPHTRDHEKDWAKLPHMEEIDYVFAHNTFEGATSEHGKQLNGIKPDMFEGSQVISGDVHTPQSFAGVTYVGSPYLVDFGDNFEPRVLLIHNIADRTRSSARGAVVSIAIPGPQKRLIEAKRGTNVIDHASKGDIVKVRYTLSNEERDKWPEIKAEIKKACADAGLILHLVQPVISKKQKSVSVKASSLKRSDEAITKEFGKQLNVTKASLEIGLHFLKEA